MKVFEESWVEGVRRRYGSMSKYTRPYVAFLALDSHVSEERAKIEEWFQTLPDEIKPDIVGRLRSKDERQHFSAYYELVMRHYFQSRGYIVTMKPKLKEGEPDLLVEGNELETPVVIEVATVFDDPEWEKEEQKQKRLLGELNTIEHYFLVGVSIRSDNIPEKVNYNRLRRFVEGWLDSFDPRVTKTMQEATYREGGLELLLTLFPKKSMKKAPVVGIWAPPGRWITPTQLRRAIEKKISKYKSVKEHNMPYVVAACLHSDSPVGEEEALNVLFGQEVYELDVRKKEVIEVKRDFSGLLTPKPGLGGLVRNTRLSALALVNTRWLPPQDNGKEHQAHFLRVLHNPNAAIRLGFELFKGYPQLMKVAEDEEHFSLEWFDKESKESFDC
jgi:hypothetical protein